MNLSPLEIELELKWHELFLPFQVEVAASKQVFSEVVEKYSTSDRYYHNLSHIQHVLDGVESIRSLAKNLAVIQMASWFHDVIYDSTAKDNEEKSAEYASISLTKLSIPVTIIDCVARMILNTKNHHALNDIDSQILIDSDLSILGSEESVYLTYAQAIRQEYAWVSEVEYQINRKRILESFLQRDRIYLTERAFQMLELKARKNIKTEISKLSG